MFADFPETLVTTHLVKAFDLGVNGNLYGGRMLDWLDEAGALYAISTYKACFVTWKVGETIFHTPVKEGEIIHFYIRNVDKRRCAVGFELAAKVEGREVLTTSMVFVCVDPQTGKKTPIPEKIG